MHKPNRSRSTVRALSLLLGLVALPACGSVDPQTGQSEGEPAVARAQLLPAGNWTAWLNRDGPSGAGDFEDRASFPAGAIPCTTPIAIAARTSVGRVDYRDTGERLSVSADLGLVCRNAEQPDGACLDYQVAFLCPSASAHWSAWLNRDDAGGAGDFETLVDFDPTSVGCSQPLAIEARTLGGVDWHLTGEVLSVSPTTGLSCRNASQPDRICQNYQVRFLCDAPRVCDTRGAPACGAGESCLHEGPVMGCNFSDGGGVCSVPPLSCASESAQVCGCDGVTYLNSCFAAQSGGGYLHVGPC